MQVLADGRWLSSAGLIVTLGIGWNPSSLAGRAGEPRGQDIFILSRIQGRHRAGTCPEVDQVLLLQRTHLLYDGPQPPLEGDETLAGLSCSGHMSLVGY